MARRSAERARTCSSAVAFYLAYLAVIVVGGTGTT